MITLSFYFSASIRADQKIPPQPLLFSLSGWSTTLHSQGLKVYGRLLPSGEEYLFGRGAKEQFLDPQVVEKSEQSVTLLYPSQKLKIKVTAIKNRLHFNFNSSIEQKLTWPTLVSLKA